MAYHKSSNKKKSSTKSKVSNLLSKRVNFSRFQLVVFALVFAMIGGYIILRSYALTGSYVKVNFQPIGILGGDGDTGYWMVAKDGGVFTQGTATFHGSVGGQGISNVVGIAGPANHSGYWEVGSDGGVFAEGVPFYGSLPGHVSVNNIVAIAARPQGDGYWLAGGDGGVFAFGNAPYAGNQVGGILAYIVGIASSGSGNGYWLVNSVGEVYPHGDAGFYGDLRSTHLSAPIVGIAKTPNGGGYWLVGADGGVFTFGNAGFYGSMAGTALTGAIVGITPTDDGGGYWLAGADGGVFAFGDAQFEGRVTYTPPPPKSPAPPPQSTGEPGSSGGSSTPKSSSGGSPGSSSSGGSSSNSGSSINYTNANCLSSTNPKPTISINDDGSCVIVLKYDLNAIGYNNFGEQPFGPLFDAVTQADVKLTQDVCKISTDGVVGVQTWNCITFLDSIAKSGTPTIGTTGAYKPSPTGVYAVISDYPYTFGNTSTQIAQQPQTVQDAVKNSSAIQQMQKGSMDIIDCTATVTVFNNGDVNVTNGACGAPQASDKPG